MKVRNADPRHAKYGNRRENNRMTLAALLALTLCFTTGCAQRYKITLSNHHEITTSSRPKLDKATETYRFKDSSGAEVILPAFRIRSIEPL
ncbi:MAG: YgdI/YgdR family lipoprotein [Verrucomicrobia subdivision 3 bacterium]|nr:YgdI/YgdR family lipoprotein [Limisphaerales bacterium]